MRWPSNYVPAEERVPLPAGSTCTRHLYTILLVYFCSNIHEYICAGKIPKQTALVHVFILPKSAKRVGNITSCKQVGTPAARARSTLEGRDSPVLNVKCCKRNEKGTALEHPAGYVVDPTASPCVCRCRCFVMGLERWTKSNAPCAAVRSTPLVRVLRVTKRLKVPSRINN